MTAELGASDTADLLTRTLSQQKISKFQENLEYKYDSVVWVGGYTSENPSLHKT